MLRKQFNTTKIAAAAHSGEPVLRQMLAGYQGKDAAVVPGFKMQPGMLYTQVRAISARINQNYDAWPSEELKKSYKTFLNRPVFVNHQNFDPEKARGRVVAARYRESGNDKYIEVIQEIDATRFPKLAKEIHEGGLDSVSMGVEAGFTKCSVCDNTATDMTDMCAHVKYHKGEKLAHVQTGEPTLVYENCYKLGFFELSYVFDPADETAVVSRVVVANRKDAVADYIPTREELALSEQKAQRKKGPVRQFIHDLADPNQVLDDLETDRKVRQVREKKRNWPQIDKFLPATANVKTDWADLGRQAYDQGKPSELGKAALRGMSAEEADFARGRYQQGWDMAEKTAAYHYADLIGSGGSTDNGPVTMTNGLIGPSGNGSNDPRKKEDPSTMSTLTAEDLQGMPSATTSYGNPHGDFAVGGGSSGGSGGSGGSSYNPGSGGKADGQGLLDNNRDLYNSLMQKFPGSDIGTYRVDSYHEHDHGALDYMTSDPNRATQVRQDAFNAGSPYVLWQQQQWNAPWYNGGGVSGMEDRGDPTQNHYDHVHIAPPDLSRAMHKARKLAWGETEAPEDIDTLRDESEDDGQDEFHHYVDSPEELRTPDFDQTKRLDRAQEEEGLDADRRVEDIEEVGAPAQQGGRMARYRYAEDGMPPGDPSMGVDPAMMGLGQPPAIDPNMGSMSPEEELALLNQAQGDLSFAESELYGGGAAPAGPAPSDYDEDGGEEDWDYDDSGQPYDDDSGAPDGDEDEDDEAGEEEEGEAPPLPPQVTARLAGVATREFLDWCDQNGVDPKNPKAADWWGQEMASHSGFGWGDGEEDIDYKDLPLGVGKSRHVDIAASRRPVRNTPTEKKVRRTKKGRSMGINLSERGKVASRGRRFHADDNGQVDGGPYGRNDQGEQEEIFLSQTPAAEAVSTPTAGESISNTENTLVARVQAGTAQLRRDAAALAYLRQQKQARRKMAGDNIVEPTTVNPELSGTDDQSLKGDDFDSIALDNVATQPKDASIHAFAAFDDWLARSTGKTARQHGNANFIRREAARYIRATGVPLGNLFPTLEKVLVEARKVEANKEATMKRIADEKLEVAAPGDRINVEAPVKNVTDAEAQASQYPLSDYASNAGDNIADPDLSTESQFWAPGGGEKTSNRMADAVAAVRCAEAYITAGLAPASEKWQLIARFQTMRHATVVDRTRLLEAKNELDTSTRRSAAVSRGASIPRGLGSGQRTAQTNRIAANDPSSDSLLFFK